MMNKTRQESILRRYFASSDYSIGCVYKTASPFKWRAESEILEDMRKFNGCRYRIISHNSNVFTCGFIWTDSAGETWLRYYTAYNTYNIKVYQ